MAVIPREVDFEPVNALVQIHRGKVRHSYALPDHPELMLVVASNRLSIFDFVLPAQVSRKGEVLTAMNVFWREKIPEFVALLEHEIRDELVAFGPAIDQYLPLYLRDKADLHRIAVVVRKLETIPFEMVVRGYLTGGGWKEYMKARQVSGHHLPDGLKKHDKLVHPLFTPSTKANVGHDVAVDFRDVMTRYPGIDKLVIDIYSAANGYAASRGIVIADTKFEAGWRSGEKNSSSYLIIDEVLTPDSSRFGKADDWKMAVETGGDPSPFDKQLVRQWGIEIGIDKRDPENEEDVRWVHAQRVPEDILQKTTATYLEIFEILTGDSLDTFHETHMRIR